MIYDSGAVAGEVKEKQFTKEKKIEVPVYDTEAFRGRWDKLEDKLVRANSIMAG